MTIPLNRKHSDNNNSFSSSTGFSINIDPRVHHSQPRIQTTSPITMTPSRRVTRSSARSTSPKVVINGALAPLGDGAVKKPRRTSLTNGNVSTNGHQNGHAVQPDDKKKADGIVKKVVDWEIPRKVLHSSIGFLVIPLYTSHASPTYALKICSAALGFITLVDFVRLRSRRFAAIYEAVLGFLMRDSEKKKINGVIWYLCGCVTVLALYPTDIAVVSILILSWCDTTASFFGRLWGYKTPALPQSIRLPFSSTLSRSSTRSSESESSSSSISTFRMPLPFASRKSVAGSLAATLTGAAIGVGFWGFLAPFGEHATSVPVPAGATVPTWPTLSVVAAVTGIVAGVAEALEIGSLDDNLTLPIISGGFLWIFFKYLGHLL